MVWQSASLYRASFAGLRCLRSDSLNDEEWDIEETAELDLLAATDEFERLNEQAAPDPATGADDGSSDEADHPGFDPYNHA